MGNVPFVDFAGAELLLHLRATYAELGIELRLAEAHGTVVEAVRRLHSPHAAGLADTNQTVDSVLNEWRHADRPGAIKKPPAGTH